MVRKGSRPSSRSAAIRLTKFTPKRCRPMRSHPVPPWASGASLNPYLPQSEQLQTEWWLVRTTTDCYNAITGSKVVLPTVRSGPPNWTKSRTFIRQAQ